MAFAFSACLLAHAHFASATGTAGTPDYSIAPVGSPTGQDVDADAKFLFMFTPSARWIGPLHWKYNHANAPQPLASSKASVIAQLQASLDKWTSQCAVTYQYDGETTTAPNTLTGAGTSNPQPDGASVVGWGTLDPTLGGWTYDWYTAVGPDRVLMDADVILNIADVTSLSELDRLMTHEWGHAIGLTHSNVESAIMAGPPYTQYNALVTPQPDDVRGCRCLYGVPPGVQAPYVCSLPRQVDFGDATVNTTSAPQNVTFTNSGNAPLAIQTASTTDAQFKLVSGCGAGTVVAPGASCTAQLTVNPSMVGALASKLVVFTNDSFYELPLVANGVASNPPLLSAPATVDVIEFYNASLDHYFISWTLAEIANLDAGNTPTRWTRTGYSFKAYATPQAGTSQVCRFYIPPADGNSHFFGRSAPECSASQQAHPDFVLEDPNYMQMFVPTAGVCPTNSQPVYRVFDNRADANHRYMTDRALRDQMVAHGWIAEGDGPDLVVMCAPV